MEYSPPVGESGFGSLHHSVGESVVGICSDHGLIGGKEMASLGHNGEGMNHPPKTHGVFSG